MIGRIWLTAKNSIFYSGRKIKGQKIRSAPSKPKNGLQICNGSGCRSSHPQSGNLNTSYTERIQQLEMTVKQKEKEKGNVSRPLFTACGDDRRFPQTFSEKKIRQPTTAVKQNHHFGKRRECAEHIYQTDANCLFGERIIALALVAARIVAEQKNKTGLAPRLQQRMKVSIRILNSFLLSSWPVLPGSLALTALPQYGSTS